MPTIKDSLAAKNRATLATNIGAMVKNFTSQTHMSEDEVIAVLAFCVGSAIGNAGSRFSKESLSEIADNWIGKGLRVATGKEVNSLIVPHKLN